MPQLQCSVEESVVVAVDIQPIFLQAIHEAERMTRRARFLVQSAKVLGVPVLATEQNPSRLGAFDPDFDLSPVSKMSFSGWEAIRESVESIGKPNVVLVGVETHICVALTALDLLNQGYNVFVCPDGVSSRTSEMHKLGMERMRDSGVMPSQTETLVYEWMGSAEHPRFRDVLKLVKEA